MLYNLFPKIREMKIINYLRLIIDSIWTMIAIVALAACANIFAIEIPVYYTYVVIIILTVLFCDDMLSLLPIACASYMTFSKNNNPLDESQTSFFITNSGKTHMLVIGIIIAVFALSRIIFDIITKKERRSIPKLLLGFCLLGLAYIIGGIFTKSYSHRTAFFGLVQILTLSFSYFVFYFTVDWKRVKASYFATLFTIIGFMMVAEMLNLLIITDFFNSGVEYSRSLLYTGWGHYNNIGSICILTLPAPFYFAMTKKNGWMYAIIGVIFYINILLTQSRNAMLFGTIIIFITAFITLLKASMPEKQKLVICYFIILIVTSMCIIAFNEQLQLSFGSIFSRGADSSGRDQIYIDGIKQFFNAPVFGLGFYECQGPQWGINNVNDFLPPRYHDTYVQLLASCGLFGMLCYLYHRFETIKLFKNNYSAESIIMFITITSFILISIFDCHFFNIGPGFLYSAVLLLAEKTLHKNKTEAVN